MINQERFEKLLAEDESNYLEFKEEIDLSSNGSKAKFVRELLSLANTPIRNGYVIIGVEDKTKELVGLKHNIAEEQVQQVVSEWCRPPIKCTYQNIEYKNKTFGVVEIYPLRPPYTLKKRTSYDEPADNSKKSKQVNLRENQVFIRRGSIIEEATIDELLEMFQADTVDMSDVLTRLDYMHDALEDIASEASHLRYIGRNPEPNEVLETIFVAVISTLLIGSFGNQENLFLPLIVLPVVTLCMIICSTLRIIHFNVRRIIATAALMWVALALWFTYGMQIPTVNTIISESGILGILYHGLVGAVIGLVAAIVLMFWAPSDF